MDQPVRSGRLAGRIRLPGSKSIAQRALVLASHKGGQVRNVPDNDDLDRLCSALRALGYDITVKGNTRVIDGSLHEERVYLDLGGNGTGARTVMALAALRGAPTTVDGSQRLRRRPIAPLCDALRQLGARVDSNEFPMTIRGPIKGGAVRVDTSISSQFATALILIVDRVRGLKVHVTGRESFSYVALTTLLQRTFKTPFVVEPDFSSAAAHAVAAATTGGDLLLDGLWLSSAQPDARLLPFLNRAGAKVTDTDDGVRVRGGPLRGIRVDLSNCSDLAPLFGVLGALSDGVTTIIGAPHLVHKESNRIEATVEMIRALGGDAAARPDGFEVRGGLPLKGTTVSACGDHRIAMAAGVLALSVPGVTVADAEAVSKSYPTFFEDLERLTVSDGGS